MPRPSFGAGLSFFTPYRLHAMILDTAIPNIFAFAGRDIGDWVRDLSSDWLLYSTTSKTLPNLSNLYSLEVFILCFLPSQTSTSSNKFSLIWINLACPLLPTKNLYLTAKFTGTTFSAKSAVNFKGLIVSILTASLPTINPLASFRTGKTRLKLIGVSTLLAFQKNSLITSTPTSIKPSLKRKKFNAKRNWNSYSFKPLITPESEQALFLTLPKITRTFKLNRLILTASNLTAIIPSLSLSATSTAMLSPINSSSQTAKKGSALMPLLTACSGALASIPFNLSISTGLSFSVRALLLWHCLFLLAQCCKADSLPLP